MVALAARAGGVSGDLAFATTAGTIAAVNPCGFVMLPTYVVLFAHRSGRSADPGSAMRRAATAALIMTAGFATVFGVVGVLLTPLVSSIQRWTPFLTVVIGAVVVGLGIAMLAGRDLSLHLPRIGSRPDGPSRSAAGMYL
jgi:cytochrome c biogenesis protein CcdA